MKKQRTTQQNKALHLFFTQLANALNDEGLDMRLVLKPNIDIAWTPENIKEYLWRPVQNAILGKKSTTELSSGDIDKIWEVLNRFLGDKFGVHVPFPSEDSLIEEQEKSSITN